MKITLKLIKSLKPCRAGYGLLMIHLSSIKHPAANDENIEFDIMEVFNSKNDLNDAEWLFDELVSKNHIDYNDAIEIARKFLVSYVLYDEEDFPTRESRYAHLDYIHYGIDTAKRIKNKEISYVGILEKRPIYYDDIITRTVHRIFLDIIDEEEEVISDALNNYIEFLHFDSQVKRILDQYELH